MPLAARYELELGRDERVEADVDRVQAGLSQAGQFPAQGQPVRRYSDGSIRTRKEMDVELDSVRLNITPKVKRDISSALSMMKPIKKESNNKRTT